MRELELQRVARIAYKHALASQPANPRFSKALASCLVGTVFAVVAAGVVIFPGMAGIPV